MEKIKIWGYCIIAIGLLFLILDAATIRFCQTMMCRATQHFAVGLMVLLSLIVGIGMINYHRMKHLVKMR
ncbi:hypothetical protein JW968_04350 [Candidatus Woesearchaeota archaeon]|nr:hypothetical protein [Candidatus Woesearchaeota archaeon]